VTGALRAALPTHHSRAQRPKQSISAAIVSYFMSLRSYMLDVVAISADIQPEPPLCCPGWRHESA